MACRSTALRANKRETIDWLKFTLEGVGERIHGYAFTRYRQVDGRLSQSYETI
jgi:hypothetical protein